ncbi:MAG: hypothetical protein OXS29_03225 [bacterium]|nr:hypothetical protein [bacterium]MDE0288457.1 hypothetical protein [bacterium]MDE0436971.1 hypothetical protein [bacterium]
MTQLDYQEIISLSEDPTVMFEKARGRPATAEELRELAQLAAAIFHQCSLEEQIEVTLCLPTHISARHLAPMSDLQRSAILTQLPAGLADEIASLLPAGVA